jgi:DNA repair/transcription protein MET18/MMS19
MSQLERETPDSWDEDIVVKEIIKGSVSVVEDTTPINGPKKTVVTETLLPFLMDLIVPEASSNAIGKALGVIKCLSMNHQFLEVVSIRLSNKITHFLQLNISTEEKADAFKEICLTLLDSILNTQANFQFLTNSWYKNFVPRFLRSFFELWSQNRQPDVAAVEAAGTLVGIIVRFLDKPKHQTSLNELTSLFLLPQNNFQLPAVQISVSSSPLVGLFNQIIANIDKTVSFEEAISPLVVSELISDITSRCQDSEKDNGYTRLCYLQMLAILSNKLVKDATLFDPFLQPTFDEISIETGKLPLSKVERFEVLVWITKGLVMKLDQRGMGFTQKLVSLLSNTNNEVQQLASKCLGILVCDLPIFTISSTSKKQVKLGSGVTPTNVRLLYKQRLFDTLLPLLMAGYQDTKDEVYLVSLSILVENVLSSLLKGHLNELSSMVISSLPIDNSVIVGSALKTLKILIDEAPELVKPHLNNIIERLIALVVERIVVGKKLVNAENVRCEALVCLSKIFQNIELEYTVPYQKGTIKKLEPALDDKKRLVRKHCCDLRQVLYELGR